MIICGKMTKVNKKVKSFIPPKFYNMFDRIMTTMSEFNLHCAFVHCDRGNVFIVSHCEKRINRICVNFLLIVLTWGLVSVSMTGVAQMEGPVPLYQPHKTKTAAQSWVTSEKLQYNQAVNPLDLIL